MVRRRLYSVSGSREMVDAKATANAGKNMAYEFSASASVEGR